jgi:hypothetical protein
MYMIMLFPEVLTDATGDFVAYYTRGQELLTVTPHILGSR